MNPEANAEIELPKYVSHKQVYALKIARFSLTTEEPMLYFVDERYAPIAVEEQWIGTKVKHGDDKGYYVVYEDGYTSWSPTKAFEEGYTRVEAEPSFVDGSNV